MTEKIVVIDWTVNADYIPYMAIKIERIGTERARWLYDHQHEVYPLSYHMDGVWFVNVLRSGLCWGCFEDEKLIAWLLITKEDDGCYIEDLAVRPIYQMNGVGRALWLHALPHLPDYIHLDARATSHDLFLKHHYGYTITKDEGAHDPELNEWFWDMRFEKGSKK